MNSRIKAPEWAEIVRWRHRNGLKLPNRYAWKGWKYDKTVLKELD